jgi:hypothetical protein
MESKKAFVVAAVALVLCGGMGAVVLSASWLADEPSAASRRPVWTEVQWPFPIDQFGRGKAFHCRAADCGTPLTLYIRAKIGFCNCTTGVADDAELERISDLELLGGKFSALGDGHPISVAQMKGRSRSYALDPGSRLESSALAIAFNDRCDAIVATVVLKHDRSDISEPNVIAFLNGPTIMRWVEVTLGL